MQLDLEQLATLERAFDGVDRLFLVGPATEDFGEFLSGPETYRAFIERNRARIS